MNTTTGFDRSANAFFQNILSQLDFIETTGRFYLPMGEAHQSLIDVEDIAAATIAVMTSARSCGRKSAFSQLYAKNVPLRRGDSGQVGRLFYWH